MSRRERRKTAAEAIVATPSCWSRERERGIGRATALAFAGLGARVLAVDLDAARRRRPPSGCREAGLIGPAVRLRRLGLGRDARSCRTGGRRITASSTCWSTTRGSACPVAWPRCRSTIGVGSGPSTSMVSSTAAGVRSPIITRGSGHVVNMSSGLAYTPLAAEPAYVTTKAAVLALSLCLPSRLAESWRRSQRDLSGRDQHPDRHLDPLCRWAGRSRDRDPRTEAAPARPPTRARGRSGPRRRRSQSGGGAGRLGGQARLVGPSAPAGRRAAGRGEAGTCDRKRPPQRPATASSLVVGDVRGGRRSSPSPLRPTRRTMDNGRTVLARGGSDLEGEIAYCPRAAAAHVRPGSDRPRSSSDSTGCSSRSTTQCARCSATHGRSCWPARCRPSPIPTTCPAT